MIFIGKEEGCIAGGLGALFTVGFEYPILAEEFMM